MRCLQWFWQFVFPAISSDAYGVAYWGVDLVFHGVGLFDFVGAAGLPASQRLGRQTRRPIEKDALEKAQHCERESPGCAAQSRRALASAGVCLGRASVVCWRVPKRGLKPFSYWIFSATRQCSA